MDSEISTVALSPNSRRDGKTPARDRTPIEIWSHIFHFATLLPSYAAVEYAGALNPDDHFSPDFRLRWRKFADDALRSSIRCRAILAQVCAEWRRANVEKVYECIHVINPSQLGPLCDILEQSCVNLPPMGYGRKSKQFSLSIPPWPMRGGRYPTDFVQCIVKILQYLPNLAVFTPSPHIVTVNVSSEIIDAILHNGAMCQSLQSLRFLGPVDLRDLGKLLAGCPALTNIALGKAWTNMEETGFSLPNLRSLHVELNNTPSSHYIQQFTRGSLPRLEQMSIVFRYQNDLRLIHALLAAHGPKINLLRLELAPGYPHGFGDLTELVDHCPQLTELIFDVDWIQQYDHFNFKSPLRRLGILTSRYNGHVQYLKIKLWVLSTGSLPETLRVVRFLDIDASDVSHYSDGTLLSLMSEISQVWAGKGVRLEDMYGCTFKLLQHILPS